MTKPTKICRVLLEKYPAHNCNDNCHLCIREEWLKLMKEELKLILPAYPDPKMKDIVIFEQFTPLVPYLTIGDIKL